MDLEAAFEADVDISYLNEPRRARLEVSKLRTRLECNLIPQLIDENTVHVRQTGHVDLKVVLELDEFEKAGEAGQLVRSSIIDSLKNVDCDLPPLSSICAESSEVVRSIVGTFPRHSRNLDLFQDACDGVFVESPASYSIPQIQTDSGVDSEDHLHVSLVKATLLEAAMDDLRHPYVILEMDHPAQRFNTSLAAKKVRYGSSSSIDFLWPKENSQFQL